MQENPCEIKGFLFSMFFLCCILCCILPKNNYFCFIRLLSLLLACLEGLKEQGRKGPVTEAIGKIEKHMSQEVHK